MLVLVLVVCVYATKSPWQLKRVTNTLMCDIVNNSRRQSNTVHKRFTHIPSSVMLLCARAYVAVPAVLNGFNPTHAMRRLRTWSMGLTTPPVCGT